MGTTYLAAGSYPINLVYFQNQGGASMEFYAAKESSAQAVSSITSSGTTATVTLPKNGFSNGETITIAGASQSQYDGNFVIANVTANTFTYTISGSPASPATGTITACPLTAGATSFDANSILVGATTATTAGGGISATTTPLAITSVPYLGSSASPVAAAIQTNVQSTVNAAIATAGSTSLYSRITFSAANLASLTSLTLRMQYDSGYIAYLNGVEVASSNVNNPASPTWNSTALEYISSPVQAATYQDIDLSSFLNSGTKGHLTATGNVLAIQTLMATPTDQTLLVEPELCQLTSVVGGDFIYSTPTPGTPSTLADVAASITFSSTHGLYYAPIQVTLTPSVAGEPIYYTTNNAVPAVQQAVSSITYSGTTATVTTTAAFGFASGDTLQIAGATPAVYDGAFAVTVTGTNTFTYILPSTPASNASGAGITATSGTLYSGPITVSTTTVLQAAMLVGSIASPYQTETYVFPYAVATQPAAPAGFPTTWVGSIDGQGTATADYAMSSVPGYTTAQIASALSSLPMMSLVTTNANMFGPDGIYANSEDKSLEVPGSFEYFNPLSGTTDFGSLAGISMYGGVGRDTQYLKHGMEVHFDTSDGKTYLNENIFGDGYLPDGLVLRQAFNDGWSWGGASTQFIIDSVDPRHADRLGHAEHAGHLGPAFRQRAVLGGLQRGCRHRLRLLLLLLRRPDVGLRRLPLQFHRFRGQEREHHALDRHVQRGNVRKRGRHGDGQPHRAGQPDGLRPHGAVPQSAVLLRLHHRQLLRRQLGLGLAQLLRPLPARAWASSSRTGTAKGMLLNAADGNPSGNITSRDTTGDPTQLFVQLLANPDFRQMFADHVYKDLSTVLSPTNAAAMYQ